MGETYYFLSESENGKVNEEICFILDRNHPYRMPEKYIEDVLKVFDCIVPQSQTTESESVERFLKKSNCWRKWCECYERIKEKYPAYETTCELYLHCDLITPRHMMIARKEVYEGYCAWLNDILSEDDDDLEVRKHLLRIWLLNNEIKVKEELVKEMIPIREDTKYRELDLKKQYVYKILRRLISDFQNNKMDDLVDCSPLNIALDDKIPVWLCWWQGEENAPELVKKCILRIRETLPGDFKIHLITMRNVGEYITLPEWIIEKYGKGQISLTHLSDVLRFGLLYRYGGLWLDATYLVQPRFWQQIQNAGDFFVCKLSRAKWTYDISEGRWASNVFYGKPGNFLFQFMLNAYYEYWRLQDELIDYYQMDYMIAVAYDHFGQVKDMIDGVEPSNPEILSLAEMLDDKYDETTWKNLIRETALFKLTYKREFAKETIVGEPTFYGALITDMI